MYFAWILLIFTTIYRWNTNGCKKSGVISISYWVSTVPLWLIDGDCFGLGLSLSVLTFLLVFKTLKELSICIHFSLVVVKAYQLRLVESLCLYVMVWVILWRSIPSQQRRIEGLFHTTLVMAGAEGIVAAWDKCLLLANGGHTKICKGMGCIPLQWMGYVKKRLHWRESIPSSIEKNSNRSSLLISKQKSNLMYDILLAEETVIWKFSSQSWFSADLPPQSLYVQFQGCVAQLLEVMHEGRKKEDKYSQNRIFTFSFLNVEKNSGTLRVDFTTTYQRVPVCTD